LRGIEREAVVSSTFEIVADIIAQTCHIPHQAITPECNVLHDLGIDSLDLLDVGFAVDDAFGIRMPLERWLHAVHLRQAAADQRFVMRELCADIDALVTATATA
jgi:acyl carrier protein